MSQLLLTATDKKTGLNVTIQGNTIYAQIFPVDGRGILSDRFSIGSLSIIHSDGEHIPLLSYRQWKTALDAIAKPEADRDEDEVAIALEFSPIICYLGQACAAMVDKLVSSAIFKHQVQQVTIGGKSMNRFSHLQTNASFIESEAKSLVRKFNESNPDQFMTLEDARQQISVRIEAYRKAKTK